MIRGCAFNPDGKWFVTASEDETIRKWDTSTRKILRIINSQTKRTGACTVSPDGSMIASTDENIIKLFDAFSGQELKSFSGHEGSVGVCKFNPDCTRLFSAGGYTVRIWDLVLGKNLKTLSGHTSWVNWCAVSPDGKRIVSASKDKTLKLWDVASGALIRTMNGHSDSVTACAFSPDGAWIISASDDKTLKIWDAISGKELRTLRGHLALVRDVAFSPDGAWIISVSKDKMLKVWEASSGCERASIPLLGELNTLALHPTEPTFICGDLGGNLYILELSGIELGPIRSTAIRESSGIKVTCPACQTEHPIQPEQLGSIFLCPNETCSLTMRINPFLVEKQAQIGIEYLEKEFDRQIKESNGEKALETINQILVIEPQNRKYHIEQICLLYAIRRMEDAEAAMTHLQTIGIIPNPDEKGRIYFLKGAAMLRLKDQTPSLQEEALEAFNLSIRFMPISRSLYYRGSILASLGDDVAALISYLEASTLQMQEDNPSNALKSLKKWKKGLYKFYFGENERDEIDLEIGWSYLSINDFTKAAAEFQAMLARGAEDPLAVYGLGLSLTG